MFHYFKLLLAVAIGLPFNCLFAQSLTILPLDMDNQPFMLEQLWQVSIVNPNGTPIESTLEIQLQDNHHRPILTAVSAPLVWQKGAASLSASVRASMRFVYEKSALGNTLRETSRLPFGNYIICYRCLDVKDQSVLGLSCRERNVTPMSPPELLNPAHGETVETLQPMLLWRGPMPLQTQGVSYALRLVEQPTAQTEALNAVQTRPPLVNMQGLKSPFLPYPMTATPLQNGKTYAWQVEAWADKVSLGVTDAWQFTVQLPEAMPPKKTHESYCWVKEIEDGRYCAASDSLRFVFNNVENESLLNFTITDKNNTTVTTTMPSVVLKGGINALALPFDRIQGLVLKEEYRLKITTAKGRRYFLTFRKMRST